MTRATFFPSFLCSISKVSNGKSYEKEGMTQLTRHSYNIFQDMIRFPTEIYKSVIRWI